MVLLTGTLFWNVDMWLQYIVAATIIVSVTVLSALALVCFGVSIWPWSVEYPLPCVYVCPCVCCVVLVCAHVCLLCVCVCVLCVSLVYVLCCACVLCGVCVLCGDFVLCCVVLVCCVVLCLCALTRALSLCVCVLFNPQKAWPRRVEWVDDLSGPTSSP